jgi:hypothetical protein
LHRGRAPAGPDHGRSRRLEVGIAPVAEGEWPELHFVHQRLGQRQHLLAYQWIGAVLGGDVKHGEHAGQRHADNDDEYDQLDQRRAPTVGTLPAIPRVTRNGVGQS